MEFLEATHNFRKRNEKSSWCVYVLHKASHREISRPSRAVTAKKCTKKCNARAELCPSSLLKLHITAMRATSQEMHGNIEMHELYDRHHKMSMASFYYNYRNPSGFCFLMLIRAIVLCCPLGLKNLNLKRKTK